MSEHDLDVIEVMAYQAARENRWLRITDYRSADGSVSSYELRFVGHGGYRDLVRESLMQLRQQQLHLTSSTGFTPADVQAGKEALDASWTATLEKPFDSTLPEAIGINRPTRELLVFTNMLQRRKTVSEVGNKAQRQSKLLTIIRERLTEQAALANFVGRLNLSPGKFQSVELLEPCHETT